MKTSTQAIALRSAPITQIVFCLRQQDGVPSSARAQDWYARSLVFGSGAYRRHASRASILNM